VKGWYTRKMHLRHLGLPVRDCDRSLRFYSTYFGFDSAAARSYPDGTIIVSDRDGITQPRPRSSRLAPRRRTGRCR
jgi:catechol 2,3-dioxygenase-like lactoylglutathione lyase family enzyme